VVVFKFKFNGFFTVRLCLLSPSSHVQLHDWSRLAAPQPQLRQLNAPPPAFAVILALPSSHTRALGAAFRALLTAP
jgi:hypothetical protein